MAGGKLEIQRKLRIAVDCRIANSQQGIGTALLALAKAFSDSDVTDQEYTFIVREGLKDWLAPYVYGPCSVVGIPDSTFSLVKRLLRPIAPLRKLWKKFRQETAHVPTSDGYIESHGFDLVHFPTQEAYRTSLPSIYQPWDLQHLHYPEFFSKAIFDQREREYRAFCAQAACVCVQAEWTKRDVMQQFGIAADKIEVIPWGAVLDAYKVPTAEETKEATEKWRLTGEFFFYPAVTWPHKNHETILRALAILKKDHGITPRMIFTGAISDHKQKLDAMASELGVLEQLDYLGFVSTAELQVIFRAAVAMVFPSKFEGFGLPVLEAFHAGAPVLCSNATTLPEVAQDGALYFDPDSAEELAELMNRVLKEPQLRAELIQRGDMVLKKFSIVETAKRFQDLYRRTASRSIPSALPTSAFVSDGGKG